MKGTMIFAAALLASTAAAHAQDAEQPPSNAQLQTRIDALEQELQASEQRQTAVQTTAPQPAPTSSLLQGWWDNTSIRGTAYLDFSNIDHSSNGIKGADNGTNFDLKRFYVAIDHKFDDVWSANLTTDVTYDSTVHASQVYIKKAYLQAKVDGDMLVVRLGSADLPWIPFVEGLYGYRYVENTLIDRTKFGTSEDWGAHVLGKLDNGLIAYQFSVVNGAGYKVAPLGGGANRSKSVDFEGRINLNYDGFVLGIGGYNGDLGKDVQGGTAVDHTATRYDAVAAYVTGKIHAGVEYFNASDWNNVTTATSDSAQGWGGFVSYKFLPEFSVFGRYDYVTPNRKTNSSLHDNYYNLGVTWSPTKIVDLSLVYKHDQAGHGTIATSNGTIGGPVNGNYSEVGLFTQIKW